MAQILIADDSKSMRQMVLFTLEEAGHTVVDAVNGQQALDEAEKQKYDLIITDIHMPEVDGLQVVEKVRSGAKNKFTPVIILTTESEPELKKKGVELGATAWIVKPFNPDQLLETIKKVI